MFLFSLFSCFLMILIIICFCFCSQERHAEEVRKNKEIREELTAWTQAPQTHLPHNPPHTCGPLSAITPPTQPHVEKTPIHPVPPRGIDPAPLTNSILSWCSSENKRPEKWNVFAQFESGCRFFVNTICFIWDNEKYFGVPFYKFFSLYLSLLVDVLVSLSLSNLLQFLLCQALVFVSLLASWRVFSKPNDHVVSMSMWRE